MSEPSIDPGTTIIYPASGGVMDAFYRDKDWSKTKLGAREGWPQSLRTALGMVLASRFPSVIFWGRELSVLYNETYIPIFGKKHPEVLGKTGFEAWAEVWDVISPLLTAVTERGETTWSRAPQITSAGSVSAPRRSRKPA